MADHLYRSPDDRMLAGVAGGLAEHWDADPSLVRLVWALLVIFTGGVALIVYIVMAIVVPEAEAGSPSAPVWNAPGPTPAPPPASVAATGAAADPTAAATGPASTAPAPGGPAPVGYWVPGGGQTRAEARAARRAARRERSSGVFPAVIGFFLVLLGGFFLARQWLPELDWDWFWPLMLIVFGVLLLVLAMGRHPTDPGTRS